MEICLVKMLRDEFQFAGLYRLDGGLRELVHADKPLLLDHRLNCRVAAVMRADIMGVVNYLDKQALLFELLDHNLTGFIAVHAAVFPAASSLRILISSRL